MAEGRRCWGLGDPSTSPPGSACPAEVSTTRRQAGLGDGEKADVTALDERRS